MKTITFYSYKGGVGRSLALSNIAKRLSEFGKKVCLIDFDLEAPGLHHKFRSNIPREINQGIVDYIHFFVENKQTPKSISDYVTKIKFDEPNYKDIDLITAGSLNSQDYWRKLSSISWNQLFYSPNGRGVELFIDLKNRIKKELKPDFLLIDSRTGITETSGITMSILAEEVVILAANNEENIDGTKRILKTLSIPENNFLNKIPKVTLVLCRIPYYYNPEEKQKEVRAINLFQRKITAHLSQSRIPFELERPFIIHSDPDLEFEEKLMIGYDHDRLGSANNTSPIAIDYLELFEEITKDTLSKGEKKKFNNIVRSEVLLKQALNERNRLTRIKLFTEVLELNPNSKDAYLNLTDEFVDIGDFKNALINIEKAIKLIPTDLDFRYAKGFIYFRSKRYQKAEKIFDEVLKEDNNHIGAITLSGGIHYSRKEYEKANEFFERIVELMPDHPEGYNMVGNTLRVMNKFEEAFEYIYKALEINPKHASSTGTLGEIYAQLGNEREFFKNLELSFAFGMSSDHFNGILEEEEVYKKYFNDSRFNQLLSKYNITVKSES